MSYVIHELVQGSDDWKAHRSAHFNASDAPAMLGMSPYQTRSDLLKEKALGVEREISPELQKVFDDGHRFEATARQWAEEIIGGDLYPIVASTIVDGLPLSASYDGATMEADTIMEHKTLNQDLAASLSRGEIPTHYAPQMEQQLLVIGASRCLFMASNGDKESMLFAWYESNPSLRATLLSSWKQFAEDVKNYQHVEVLPPPTGKALMALPPLTVHLVGEVKESNLAVYRQTALAFINAINTSLQTDQDFADAEKTVKFCGDAEAELEAVKKRALAQTASIDELFSTVDMLREEMRGKRLELEKLVKARKETIREEIRRGGIEAAAAHAARLNLRLGKPYLPPIACDFAGAMKGKKTIAGLRDAVNAELARYKIEANAVADRIAINLNTLRELGTGSEFLFSDTAQIVLKANDDLTALVKMRIAEHKTAEEKRLEAEREKIRKEEESRAEARVRAEEQAKEAARVAKETAAAQVLAQPQSGAPSEAQHPQPAPAAAPTTDDTGRLRARIIAVLNDLSHAELRLVMDAVMAIREA